MEARHKNGPKALSDEASSPEQATDGGGAAARAYYECVFCKRGFSNAQALGGHMNIHRKDRAKMRQPPPPTTSNLSMKSEEEFNLSKNYVMYFGREEVQMDSYGQPVQELSLFGADQELHSEGFVTGGGNEKEVVEEREVDLELRLGHQQP